MITTDYMCDIFDTDAYTKVINNTRAALDKIAKHTPFEAIAFRGMSGAALAYPLSYLMDIPLLCVRKKKNSCHSIYKVEGYTGAGSYIIIDDFIETGNTVNKIIKHISKHSLATPVGIYLYNNSSCCAGYCEESSFSDSGLVWSTGGYTIPIFD